MRIIEPGYEILDTLDGQQILQKIETIGRVCYKSEDRMTADSAAVFLRQILKSGHESVVEHEKVTVRIICDRGVSHEIVRHRIASYSQESTRYCNYAKDKFGNEITVIRPSFWAEDSTAYGIWKQSMEQIEKDYFALLAAGAKPEEARSVLPNSLKTEIVCTMNLREWRHFFRLRTSMRAHPQIREIAIPLLKDMQTQIPVIFDDITV